MGILRFNCLKRWLGSFYEGSVLAIALHGSFLKFLVMDKRRDNNANIQKNNKVWSLIKNHCSLTSRKGK